NPKSSPLVELQSQVIAVGGDLAVARAPTKAVRDGCARSSNSAGSASPYVAAESESVAVGGAAIAIHLHGWRYSGTRAPDNAERDDFTSGTQSSEGHRHRWRRNPKSPPWVELQSQSISMGGDIAVRERRIMPSAMISPVGTQSSDGHRHRWRRTPKSPP